MPKVLKLVHLYCVGLFIPMGFWILNMAVG